MNSFSRWILISQSLPVPITVVDANEITNRQGSSDHLTQPARNHEKKCQLPEKRSSLIQAMEPALGIIKFSGFASNATFSP